MKNYIFESVIIPRGAENIGILYKTKFYIKLNIYNNYHILIFNN